MVDDITAALASLSVKDNTSQAIDAAIAGLRQKYKGKKVPLEALEAQLAALRTSHAVSMTSFSKHIRARGICLGNCKVYGSPAALAEYLYAHRKMIVPREVAKEYKHVRRCLIILYGA